MYKLQQEAPKPNAILCTKVFADKPEYYGNEFHGALSHQQAAALLDQNGDYLVRISGQDENLTFTLSLK